jgi:hydroxypyruvate isomerase
MKSKRPTRTRPRSFDRDACERNVTVLWTRVLRFAANLATLFGEVGFLERFARARAAGFDGVEIPFPYVEPKERLKELLQEHALEHVLMHLPAGNWERGDRGLACLPERRGEFRDAVGLAIEYASALGCRRVSCLAGIARGITAELARDTFIDNLRFAAAACAKGRIQLLIEPLNTREVPDFFLNQSAQALDIIDATGSENVWLQYDVYHMQVMQGYLVEDIRRCFSRIAHFQVADNPGRHQPGTGDIDYPRVFREIELLRYAGWIGCAYEPLGTSRDALAWLRAYRRGAFARDDAPSSRRG